MKILRLTLTESRPAFKGNTSVEAKWQMMKATMNEVAEITVGTVGRENLNHWLHAICKKTIDRRDETR